MNGQEVHLLAGKPELSTFFSFSLSCKMRAVPLVYYWRPAGDVRGLTSEKLP
jgi:hypothetical protein